MHALQGVCMQARGCVHADKRNALQGCTRFVQYTTRYTRGKKCICNKNSESTQENIGCMLHMHDVRGVISSLDCEQQGVRRTVSPTPKTMRRFRSSSSMLVSVRAALARASLISASVLCGQDIAQNFAEWLIYCEIP